MWAFNQNTGTKILSWIAIGFLIVSASSSETTNDSATKNATPKQGNGPCATTSSPELYDTHPILCEMLDRIEDDVEGVASEMTEFARKHYLLVGEHWDWDHLERSAQSSVTTPQQLHEREDQDQLPVVFAHGMGDSCFNSGMIHIGTHASDLLGGAYVVCIPTGDTRSEDTTNGYFLNMDTSVDVFASKIARDPRLRNGFHAVGFSQGNNVIRGYIARYNTPTVHTFLSVNGVNAGEGTVPGCFPNDKQTLTQTPTNSVSANGESGLKGSFCDLLLEQASRRAYTTFSQKHSFQSNYWRDPRQSKQEDYHEYSQLARWNNEGPNHHNQTLNENFAKTSRFVWIMAKSDSMVWPKEGEHWGCPDNSDSKDPFANPILPMNETEWYQKDLFGLKTAQEEGKNVFESFEGDHLRFTMEDFDRWVVSYLSSSSSSNTLQ